MAQVSELTRDDSIPPKSDSSPSPFSSLNYILGAIALLFIVTSATFLVLFITSKNETNEAAKELEELRGIESKSNEPMTCRWMKECRRDRSGAPPLLVISMDGFANRYLNWESTPTIKKMGVCGGRAESMYPSFPSKTFPNHYTIATGLYPGAHGIIDNRFYTPDGTKYNQENGSFYSGEPIWNTVVKNGKAAKTFLWLGSYDKINGIEATFHHKVYNNTMAFVTRIDEVIDWLIADDPPALSMLYLEEPDGAAHKHGPDADQVKEAVIKMDGLINYTLRKLKAAGVLGCTNIVLVSDHGMRNVKKAPFNIKCAMLRINLEEIDPEYSKVVTGVGNNVLFYGNVSTAPLKCKKGNDYRVYRSKDEVPLRYHFNHENIGFPYIAGSPGTLFERNGTDLEKAVNASNLGNHGWDNMDTQMQAMFYTMGPSIRSNITLKPFQNINLYNLFADLMQIPAAPNNGTTGLLDELLAQPPKRENPIDKYSVQPCDNVSFRDCGNQNEARWLTRHDTEIAFQTFSVSNTTGYLGSRDASVCSISTGRLFLLYSKSMKRSVGMEVLVKKPGSYGRQVVTTLNGQVVGPKCGEEGGKSAFAGSALESSLMLTWSDFASLSLVEKAIARLEERKSTRIQVGFVYGPDGSTKSVFVTGFWCEGAGWRPEMDYCMYESDTRTESYVIPASANDNFNCLDDETLLLDYRTTLTDIENLNELSLLPNSMPLSMRRRISVYMPSQIFK